MALPFAKCYYKNPMNETNRCTSDDFMKYLHFLFKHLNSDEPNYEVKLLCKLRQYDNNDNLNKKKFQTLIIKSAEKKKYKVTEKNSSKEYSLGYFDSVAILKD